MLKKILIACLFIMVLTACEPQDETKPELVIYNGSVAVTDDHIQQVIDAVNTFEYVDLKGYSMTIYGTAEEVDEHCFGSDEGELGCHSGMPAFIHTFWPTEFRDYTPSVVNGMGAYIICHEMAHAYLYKTTGNGDAKHTHTEWFDLNRMDSYCGQVYDQFHKEKL